MKLATQLPHWSTSSKEEMGIALAEQLKKLQTDRIDYYLVHNLNGETWNEAKKNGVIAFLDDALRSGKIINAGFSYQGSAEDFPKVVDEYDWNFCQIQYNFLDTNNQAGKKGLQYAADKQLAVMIMEPLRGGNLAKTPPHEVKRIWETAIIKRTPADWALRWIWNHLEVTVVLSGMNEIEQINQNVNLAAEVTFGSMAAAETAMLGGVLTEEKAFASQCVKECPQNIEIPELLEDVKKDMEGIMTKPMLWIIKRVMNAKKKTNKAA